MDWAGLVGMRQNETDGHMPSLCCPKAALSSLFLPSALLFSPLLHFVRCLDVSEVARSVDHSTVTDAKIWCIIQFGCLAINLT